MSARPKEQAINHYSHYRRRLWFLLRIDLYSPHIHLQPMATDLSLRLSKTLKTTPFPQ